MTYTAALANIRLPDLQARDIGLKQKLQALYEYMIQLDKHLRHMLENLDTENLSGELQQTITGLSDGLAALSKTVSMEHFQTYVQQTAKKLESKADASYTDPQTGAVLELWSQLLQTADRITAIVSGEDAVGQVQTTNVSITANGVNIKTGGVFTVDSGNFTLDGSGNLSASGAQINGSLYNNGYPVLTPLDIYIGTTEPSQKRRGMVWIKPSDNETPSVSQTTHTWSYTQGSRQGLRSYPVTGVLTGAPAARVGNQITYEFSIPVFLGDTVNGATVTITVNGHSFSGTVSGSKYDHRTVVITAPYSTWLADTSAISFTLTSSSNNVLNNKADGGYQIRMVSRCAA